MQWLESNSQYALLLVPILAFSEACIGIGLFISGAFLVGVASYVVSTDIAALETVAGLAFVGALLGDHAGFFTGRFLGPRFHESNFAKRYQTTLDKGEALIKKRGYFAIFIGRFIPAIRSIIPALVGLSDFKPLRYSLFAAIACLFWAGGLALIVAGVDTLI